MTHSKTPSAFICICFYCGYSVFQYIIILVCLQFVPLVVELCTQVVAERGIDNQGIYRVPGNSVAINALVEELNRVCSVTLRCHAVLLIERYSAAVIWPWNSLHHLV